MLESAKSTSENRTVPHKVFRPDPSRYSARTIRLLAPVIDLLKQIKPLRVQPDDYILVDEHSNPINQDKFGQRKFQAALTALKIRHRDFYHTRHTFISAMLTHDENPKRIAEYVGNSPEMIYRSYGKWIGSKDGFGETALHASKKPPFWPVKSEPSPEPRSAKKVECEQQVVGLVEAVGQCKELVCTLSFRL